nr:methyltransferase [uncultured Sphingomonas sp.]
MAEPSAALSRFADDFADANKIADYADGPPRFLPGFDALHRMTIILLQERLGPSAELLVLGAGGGLELDAMARAEPGWRFVGVDPSGPMLDLARARLGNAAERVTLVEGLIDDAPAGPFDGATCLLTLHFLPPQERVETLIALRARLRPGTPLVVAHGSFPQHEREQWLQRYAAYARTSGVPAEQAELARARVAAEVNMLDPAEDERLLAEAGFSQVALFFAAFTWRGWVATA